ncbi:MAG: YibE/F family protein [Victivallales bacterium]|nr:YibE/F family protein [Victivallales bacterium]
MNECKRKHLSDGIACAVFLLACVFLGRVELFKSPEPEAGSKERAVVLETDDSDLQEIGGVMHIGSQALKVRVETGRFAGREFRAFNQLRANLELDKVFAVGDSVLVGIPAKAVEGETVLTAQDHYRIGWTLVLFGLFAVLLVAFSGMTGFKALVSFIFSCIAVWRLLVPLCLRGISPLWVCIGCVFVLTAVIMFLVAGLSLKCIVASSGAMLGVLFGCLFSLLFTRLFHVTGTVMPYSQVLLFSGFGHLNMQELFAGAVILSSSGAVMDLGMDVAAGMEELAVHKPDIGFKELLCSGLHIGQSVVGTMATTLLLAYSGGYLTLMMTFAAQGTRPIDFINNPFVAAESVKTLIGSFSLVLVAPFTAIVGALLYKRKWTRRLEECM